MYRQSSLISNLRLIQPWRKAAGKRKLSQAISARALGVSLGSFEPLEHGEGLPGMLDTPAPLSKQFGQNQITNVDALAAGGIFTPLAHHVIDDVRRNLSAEGGLNFFAGCFRVTVQKVTHPLAYAAAFAHRHSPKKVPRASLNTYQRLLMGKGKELEIPVALNRLLVNSN